ncbi:energy coupling factor transporter S component ThiW [Vagococcus sp.]|uniref:energy coupling factor transporter S component ThiW n=1 Tax=Vagococcus sp. TaxID=1933889 RepID=UPI003F9CAF28
MVRERQKTQKLIILALMIALDVVLSPLFRIEGMAPMSSVLNIIGATLMGPVYVTIMALVCGLIRMLLLGIPPLALTGALFGALFAGVGYRWSKQIGGAVIGEIIGTGVIGSLLSYPVMVWFTGSTQKMYWLIYTPRFIGAAFIGGFIAYLIIIKLVKQKKFKEIQNLFERRNS